MAYTENDIKENIDAGNIYIKPNIRGELSTINDYEYGNPSVWDLSFGTLNVLCTLADTTSNHYMYFKDGSYIRVELVPTWAQAVTPVVTALAFNAYFGIMQDDGTIDEITFANVTGLSGTFPIYQWVISPTPLDPDHGYWELRENVYYHTGDTFMLSLTWWEQANPKLRYMFTVQTAGAGRYNIGDYLALPMDAPLLEGGIQSGMQLNTVDGQKIAQYLSGDKTEGTKYPGEPSKPGGGDGDYYRANYSIPRSTFPTTQAIDFGFNTIYTPSDADMRTISRWLWSDDFEENIKMNYSSPFENIITVALLSYDLNSLTGYTAGSNFYIGGYDSGIATTKVLKEYLPVECGERYISYMWKSFLDYDSTFTLWLPYIGYRSIKPDDVLGRTLGVSYKVDLLTGMAVAEVYVKYHDDNYGDMEQVLYSYNCNVFYNIAISGANYMSMYNQQLNATANGINNLAQSVSGAMGSALSGNVLGAVSSLTNMFTGQAQAKRQYETAKPDYGRGGNSGGNSGIFSQLIPYLIIYTPEGFAPDNYEKLQGIPSQTYAKLSTLTGYTEIDTTNIKQLINCTDEEQKEILRLLQGGVFL